MHSLELSCITLDSNDSKEGFARLSLFLNREVDSQPIRKKLCRGRRRFIRWNGYLLNAGRRLRRPTCL